MQKITELAYQNDRFNLIEWYPVIVQDYGSEGSEPVNAADCPLKSSCIGSSGDNLCGYFMGFIADNIVRCCHDR